MAVVRLYRTDRSRPLNIRPARRQENGGGRLIDGPLVKVEMAGIEPASEEFGKRHATSLFGLLILLDVTSTDGVDTKPADPSEEGFGHLYRRRGDRTPVVMTPVSAPPEARAERTWSLLVTKALTVRDAD